MSIISAIQNGAKAAFSALSEFKSDAIFKQYYRDASNDRVLRSIDVDGILTDYTEFERQRQNMPFSTKKFIVLANLFGNITPNIADSFEIDAYKWRIESLELDPSGTIYSFQIEK